VNIVVTPAAAADLDRLRAFLAKAKPGAAQRADTVISGDIQSLDVFPDRGRLSEVAGARELVVPFARSAHVVRYAHVPEAK
jgi:plasmid stabilization system protein ParE